MAMRFKSLILLANLLAATGFSSTWQLSSEKEFANNKVAFEGLFDTFPVQSFEGVPHKGQTVEIEYKAFINPSAIANIVIVHGYTENFIKYQELIYDMYNNGFSVYMYNQRGHGASQLLENQAIFVEDFDHYVEDLKIFTSTVVDRQGKPTFLFAHSLGGGVSARFMQAHPNLVDGAILNSPMTGMVTKPFPQWLAKGIGTIGTLLGMEEFLAPGQNLPRNNWTFETSNTTSVARYEYYRDNVYSEKYKDFRRGGATVGFVNQNFIGTDLLSQQEEINKIQKPVMLFQAERDTWVNNDSQVSFCEKTDRCTFVKIKDAKHEIYLEADAIRNPYLSSVFDFLQQQSQRAVIGAAGTDSSTN